MSLMNKINSYKDELTQFRHDLHAHPELGLEEHRTAGLVAQKLKEYGLDVHEGVGTTGVVGVLRCGNSGKSIGLRADMDALPMEEENDLPYRSTIPNRMHACGHDGHTTMLLGAARYLASTRNFNGTVNFIFQPGEEGVGGALAMLKDDLLTRFPCDALFGMHNTPGLPVGQFMINSGSVMAGGAFFDISIEGKGSHGSRPESSIDPMIVAASTILALQSIVSRNLPPAETAVISVTRMESSTDAYNVIPHKIKLGGTVRCFSSDVMETIRKRMAEIAEGTAATYGATAKLDFRLIFAPTFNDPACTKEFVETAVDVMGQDRVNGNAPRVMGSEDFSFMLEKAHGAYGMIGNGEGFPPHHPKYNFNDEALPYGVALYVRLVERLLPTLQDA